MNGKQPRPLELTFRAVFLGAVITVVFTAANVYLGLKVGLTFASTIPAAVISMAILSAFKDSSILENNIVQTVASAAGTLSSIIFVLPGLVIIGWWTGFPFWESFLICAAGGVLGVTFTIPLRRALVTNSPLPYPEGVAAAEVLKVGDAARASSGSSEAREGLLAVVLGSIASAALVTFEATQLAAPGIDKFFRMGAGATGAGGSFSLALLGVGHLVGLATGLAMLLGLVIAWGAAVPILTAMHPDATLSAADLAQQIWAGKVRFIGAGAIALAAIWTLGGLARPVIQGLISSLSVSHAKARAGDERERDLSPAWVILLSGVCLAISGWLVWQFAAAAGLEPLKLTIAAVIAILVLGFLVAAICGYMAGLIGSSNSPISGVGILAVVASALVYMVVAAPTPEQAHALTAFTLFATAIVFSAATIANGNLQDLKTGQLVGATPWRQQVALVLGVFAGAIVIPPVLDLLAQAYGFAGAPHVATAVTAQPLAAPQAGLISALARGVIEQKLDWGLIGIGAVLGAIIIALDEGLAAVKLLRLPPLGVGIGIYLPMETTVPVVLGAIIGWWFERYADNTRNPARTKRLGVLVASGLIVGESLFGVLLAGLIVGFNRDAPLAVVALDWPYALPIGAASFGALIVLLYGWMMRRAKTA